jgi:tight adherence protein B
MSSLSVTGMTPDLLVLLGSALVAVTAWLLSSVLAAPGGDALRQRRLARAVGGVDAPPPDRSASVRRRHARPILRPLATRRAASMSVVQRLQARLLAASISIAATDLLAALAAIAIVLAALIYMFLLANVALALGSASLLTLGLTHLILKTRSERQARRFSSQLPEAIDLIVRGVRSGLPVTEAMNTVAAELQPPIATVFQNVASSVRIGKTVEQALWSEANKLPVPEMKFFIISLSIQQETGGNLADILENLSAMIRKREQLRQKIKAMSSEARASAMIIGSLPFIMSVVIYFVNPEYISGLITDHRGWMLIGAALTSLTLGVIVMMKMIRFEI